MARYVPKEQALASPTRRAVLGLVAARPGITLTQLAGHLGCRPSTILWHAGKLEAAGLLRSERVGPARVHYLASGGLPLRDAVLGRARLDHPLARRIHELVAQRPGLTLRDLGDAIARDAATVRWHVRKLVSAGLLALGDGPGRADRFYPGVAPPAHAGPPEAAAP